MDDMLHNLERFGVFTEIFDGKILLVCNDHKYAYSPTGKPTKGCKKCHFVQHAGLLMAVPEERREEILSDLEFSVHHLLEAAQAGTLDLRNLAKHSPKVRIESEDGMVREY